jgi:hypothetical protein
MSAEGSRLRWLRVLGQRRRSGRPSEPIRSVGARQRRTGGGDTVDVALIRGFLKRALEDDAVADPVNELLFDHVVAGRFHPSVVAETLPSYIHEILNTATREDRQALADELIAEAREIDGEV